jgi:hypothetical protein
VQVAAGRERADRRVSELLHELRCAPDAAARPLVFALQNMPAAAAERFATGVNLFGYSLRLQPN